MAHKKAGGSAENQRDSGPQYLGVKIYDGQKAKPGSVIVRQRGSKILSGVGTDMGRDYTIFSIVEGTVKFSERRKNNFNGTHKRLKVASVIAA